MALDVYRKKRKFGVTPEPRGRKARGKGNRFVIQKHAATRLHYDLRLELDGVMKSWAVTRGPSLVPGEKRLAVEVEDHPVEYNAFEGTIPKGEYGGGTVMIWDRGTWTPEEDPHRGLKKGHLDFSLDGEKLNGHWHLVRMHRRPGEKRNNWLLIKATDEAARTAKDADILEEMPESVVSGRSIEEIAAGKGKKRVWHSNRTRQRQREGRRDARQRAAGEARPRKAQARSAESAGKKAKSKSKKKKRARSAALPDFVPPSLATLRDKAPNGAGWVHEIKFDGYRMQARLDHGEVKLLTRKGLDWAAQFPNVAADVARLAGRDRADRRRDRGRERARAFGFLDAAGGAQQRRARQLRLLCVRPAASRRRGPDPPAADRAQGGAEGAAGRHAATPARSATASISRRTARHVWQQACQMELEGIVSKRADAPYRPGRTDSFIKIKCANAQELVVGGYAPSTVDAASDRRAGGGLLSRRQADLCRPRRHRLHARGREGPVEAAASARDRQAAVRRDPAGRSAPPRRALGRAEDGDRSRISAAGPATTSCGRPRSRACARTSRRRRSCASFRPRSTACAARAAAGPPRGRQPRSRKKSKPRRQADKHAKAGAGKGKARSRGQLANEGAVRFTHPDRVYWADAGVTKQDLADYYTVGVGLDGAARRQRAAEPAALSRRHQGPMLLPEARLGRASTTSCCAASSTASAGR